jgi:predicted transcriptional regulator
MKHALTIRLERTQLVALRRLAEQREVSQASLAGEAIDAYLEGQQLADLGRLAEELRAGIAQHATAMQEQRDLFRLAQEKNAEQVAMVLAAQSAAMQPLIDALGGTSSGGSGGGGPPSRPPTQLTPPQGGESSSRPASDLARQVTKSSKP